MANELALKPCPFCGGESITERRANGWIARCARRFEDCAINGRTHHYGAMGEAIIAWNTRAAEPAADVATVPAIWPIGHGVVLTAHSVAGEKPLFFLRAVRDDLIGEPGTSAPDAVWDELSDAPTLTLAFADADALDRHISSLTELRAALQAQPAEPTDEEVERVAKVIDPDAFAVVVPLRRAEAWRIAADRIGDAINTAKTAIAALRGGA